MIPLSSVIETELRGLFFVLICDVELRYIRRFAKYANPILTLWEFIEIYFTCICQATDKIKII